MTQQNNDLGWLGHKYDQKLHYWYKRPDQQAAISACGRVRLANTLHRHDDRPKCSSCECLSAARQQRRAAKRKGKENE